MLISLNRGGKKGLTLHEMVGPARESSFFSLYYMPEIDKNNGIQSKPFSQMNSEKLGHRMLNVESFIGFSNITWDFTKKSKFKNQNNLYWITDKSILANVNFKFIIWKSQLKMATVL